MTEIELHAGASPIRDLVPGVTEVKVDVHRGGPCVRVSFENGYGASVVRNAMSYGAADGLWELGVLGTDGGLTYLTPIADDVIGHLSSDEVIEKLTEISALTAEEVEHHTRVREVAEIAEELAALLNRAEAARVWVTQSRTDNSFSVLDAGSSGPLVTLAVCQAENTNRWEVAS